MDTKKNILVADDFTSVADCAIKHACTIAKINNDNVILCHVLDSNSLSELKKNNKSYDDLKNEMRLRCEKYSNQFGVDLSFNLDEGTIFKSIGEKANELSCSLIVLGTHGVKGMQHIVGARALKVVASSKVPIIVVQEKGPIHDNYKKIVVPVDHKSETKQKTLQCINVAKMFDAQIFLYKQFSKDDDNIKNINNNITFMSNHFNENNIKFEVFAQEHHGSFEKEFIEFAENKEADLIVILTTVDKDLKDLVMGPVEEFVINNKNQIPVMCVNPLQSLYTGKSMSSIISFS